jgi:hypothetical protein
MSRLLLFLAVTYAAWYGYQHFVAKPQSPAPSVSLPLVREPASASFKCDGRTHCSQMASCAEAKFFLRNCPNTKIDGDNDGIPCEMQWCR